MQNTPTCDDDVLELNTPNNQSKKPIPLKSNQSSCKREQIHTLLSRSPSNSKDTPFDKALRRQQQLFTISTTLERQTRLLDEIDTLLNSQKGITWLDSQIKELKTLCPSNILMQLAKPSHATSPSGIKNSEIINLDFISLINEIFYIPLNALSTIKIDEISDNARKEWFEWCLKIDQQLVIFKVQVRTAQSFFNLSSFDKIYQLADDEDTKKQLKEIAHLFELKNN